jgi:hypothetical protein
MRFKSRGVLLALVAVFVMSVVGSASASAALPEFVPGEGAKFPITVEYSNWHPTGIMESGGSIWSSCKGLKAKGEITSAKTMPLTFELENCNWTSEGYKKEVEVYAGSGSLVYVNKATKQVGLAFKLNLGDMKRGEVDIKTRGTIVIALTPINTKTSTLDVVVTGERGKQEPREYENEKGEKKRGSFEFEFRHDLAWWEGDLSLSAGEEVGLSTTKPVTIKA